MMSMRLFFGIALDRADSEQVQHWRRAALGHLPKAVPARNYHLTLAFMGELPQGHLEQALAGAAALPFSPFSLTLDSFGQWPRSGISFLAPSQPPAPLLALAAALQQLSCDLGGFCDKRRYQPHLTLARAQHQPLVPRQAPPALTLSVTSFDLFHSDQGRYLSVANFG